MKNGKYLIIIGSVVTGVSILALSYQFYSLYSLVGCPDDSPAQSCGIRAYNDWMTLNIVELILLVIGIAALTVGMVLHYRNKSKK